MADYWITFRLARNIDHDDRLKALTAAIKDSSSMYWDEPASFILVRSDLKIDDLGETLEPAIDVKTDLVVIGELLGDETRFVGTIFDSDLRKFLPDIRKL